MTTPTTTTIAGNKFVLKWDFNKLISYFFIFAKKKKREANWMEKMLSFLFESLKSSPIHQALKNRTQLFSMELAVSFIYFYKNNNDKIEKTLNYLWQLCFFNRTCFSSHSCNSSPPTRTFEFIAAFQSI